MQKNSFASGFHVTVPHPLVTLPRRPEHPIAVGLGHADRRMIFGEMGDALLLASTKVLPKRLLDAGFIFKYPDLKPALEHAIK